MKSSPFSPKYKRIVDEGKGDSNLSGLDAEETRRIIPKLIISDDCKKFFLHEDICELLRSTNNKIYERNLPFDCFYLDLSGLELPFIDGVMITNWGNTPVVTYLRLHPVKFNEDIKDWDREWKIERDLLFVDDCPKSDLYQIRIFICNFLDFLNNPEVELLEIDRTKEQNARRVKKGKYPIRQLQDINLTGKLKIYLENMQSDNSFNYSYRFWVRGHFRILKNKRYGVHIGKKKWILPYIKGDGILVNKNYNVKSSLNLNNTKEVEDGS